MEFSFLQVSDVHLGRPFGWLSPEKRVERRLELREVWRRTVEEAVSRRVDALLVPGDLFDGEEVDPETVNRAIECVSRPDCPPVFIAPGNHDCFSRANVYYDNHKLQARGQKVWPEHVHIYTRPEFTATELPGQPEIKLWGRCVHANVESDERILVETPPLDGSSLHVALLHGSRDGFRKPGKRLTAPFSDLELLSAGFDYVALGHYHEPSEIRDQDGVLRAAYSGSAAALDRDELGDHGALEVKLKIEAGSEREKRLLSVTTTRVEVDPRRLVGIEVDLSDCGSRESARDRVLAALEQNEVRSQDLVRCQLMGRPHPGVEVIPEAEDFAGKAWYFHFDASAVRPAYDLDSYLTRQPNTTEERFVRSLLAEIEAEEDREKKAILEAALYYGLDALIQGQVAPRYEWGLG